MAERYERPDEWEEKFQEWLAEKKKRDPQTYTKIKREIAETPISLHNEPIKATKTTTTPEYPDFSDKVQTRKPKKIEKYVIVTVYVIVIGFAIYLLLASFLPNYLPFNTNEYIIDAEDSLVFGGMKSFYIDDTSVLGKVETIGETKTRLIISPKKFNLVLKPKTNIPEGTNATIILNLLFSDSKSSDIYINDQLVFPNLANYEKIAESKEDYIYANKVIVPNIQKDFLGTVGDTEQFIYKNFPDASIWATRDLLPIFVTLPDYKQEETLINTSFRDNLNLAVYTKGNLIVSGVKQDLNQYIGPDEYNLTITNSAGELIHTQMFSDDGVNTKGNAGKDQPFSVAVPNLPEGVYYVSFTKDTFNDYADSTIKNIKINSNKILIIGSFLPWEPIQFHTETSQPRQIGFYHWLADNTQRVIISGTHSKTVNLNDNRLGIRLEENLTAGSYDFSMEKGKVWVYSGIVSPTKENWFTLPPSSEKEKFNSHDILIIGKDTLHEGNYLIYKQKITIAKGETKTSLRILDPNTISFVSAELKIN